MGSRKAKQENEVQKSHFLQHCVHRVQASLTYCLQKSFVPSQGPKAHRALGNCDRMHEQTDFSTFQLKKAKKKGDIHQKNPIKGERNGLFQKGPKRRKKGEQSSTFEKGLIDASEEVELLHY